MTSCRRSLFALCLSAAQTACTQLAPGSGTARPVVLAREDLSPGFVEFMGPKAQHAPPFLDIPGTNFYCLRSFLDRRTGAVTHQLYVSDSYFGTERGWNAARDSAGTQLPLTCAHQRLLESSESAGFGQLDNSAIIRAFA